MSEIDNYRASQYLHNIRRVIEAANLEGGDTLTLLTATLSLAETYLSLDPLLPPELDYDGPVFFLHTLWCDPSDQGLEQAIRDFEAFLRDCDSAKGGKILTSLRNVLIAVRQVPSIREDLQNPYNINDLIYIALLYAFVTSGDDWFNQEELDCLYIFLSDVWNTQDATALNLAASNLQTHIENSSVGLSESIFADLLSGRITTPNIFLNDEEDI